MALPPFRRNEMSKHFRQSCYDEDSDPFEVISGFKQLPRYECRLCGDFFPTDNLKEASWFDHSIGEYDDPKPICFDCAKKVDGWDWRVF